MMNLRSACVAISCALAGLVGCDRDRDAGDRDLSAYVDSVRAIDVHAHPLRYVATGAAKDSDFDALPLDGLPPFQVPLGLRTESPLYRAAQHALFRVSLTDTGAPFAKALADARAAAMREHGDQFPSWALDRSSIDVMLANRIVMGAGLDPPRFRWVPFADALMLPLDTRGEAARTPDTRALYPLETKLLRRYVSDLGLTRLPASLDAYQKQVVTATLERQKAAGAVGIKFEAAYLRSLNFGPPEENEARRIYQHYAKGGTPGKLETLKVQDVLFRVIAHEAGRLKLAVHIHTGTGCGTYFDLAGSNPTQLESVLDDPSLRKTTFVLIHGGSGPYTHEASFLLGKPNVYSDFSEQDALIPPRALAAARRADHGLVYAPGSSIVYSYVRDLRFGREMRSVRWSWDVVGYATNLTARRGLAIALTGMINDGEITRERALEIAEMVLRGNALKLYGLKE